MDKSAPGNRENLVATQIVEASYRVHTQLGPGLLESVYEQVLAYELYQRGLSVKRQHPIPVHYDDLKMHVGFRADLVIDDCVIVEIKSVRELAPVHFKQLYTYLRLAHFRLGLMVNFGEAYLKNGIRRVVNDLPEEPRSKAG